MNKLLKLILAVALATSVVSCDYIGKLIGRSSDKEMEEKLRKIEQIEAARKKALERTKAEADSIKAANPRPTAEERKSVQQRAFERAEAEALEKSQAKNATTKTQPAPKKEVTTKETPKKETPKKETPKQEVKTTPAPQPKQEVKQASKVEPNIKAAPYPIAKIESDPKLAKQTPAKQPAGNQVAKTQKTTNSLYDVVLGSFFYEENAKELRSVAQNYNYDARLVHDGDWTAVFVSCPADNRADAAAFLEKIKQEPFCPKDAWLRAK